MVTYERQRIRDVAAIDDSRLDAAPGADSTSSRLDALVVVRVYGEDAGVLRDQASAIRRIAAASTAWSAPRVETPDPGADACAIEVDLAAAQRLGIKPGDVRRAAATLLSGIEVGSLFEEQKVFDVVVRAHAADAPQPRRASATC